MIPLMIIKEENEVIIIPLMIVLWMCFDCLSWLSFYFYWEAVKFPYSSTVLYIKLQNILCSTVLKKSETWECKKNLLVSDNRTLNTKKKKLQYNKKSMHTHDERELQKNRLYSSASILSVQPKNICLSAFVQWSF